MIFVDVDGVSVEWLMERLHVLDVVVAVYALVAGKNVV